MKKLILLLFFIFYQSIFSQWEKTNWCNNLGGGLWITGNYLILGNGYDGVFISIDSGSAWSKFDNGVGKGTGTNAILIPEENFIAGGYGYCLLTTNLGKNWIKKQNGMPDYPLINSIVFLKDKIFTGLDGGLFISTDLGESWTLQNNGIQKKKGFNRVIVINMMIKDTNLFAATQTGIYLSTNYGDTWLPKNYGLPIDTFYFDKLESYGENIYTAQMSNDGYNRIYLSTNMGEFWIQKNNTFLVKETLGSIAAIGDNLFASTGNGVYLSKDKGDSWTHIGLSDTTAFSLTIIGDFIYAGTILGVLRAKISDFTDVEDNNALTKTNSLIIYPNPTTNTISLNIHIANICSPSIKLYNSLGLLVYNEFCRQLFPGKYTKSIDVSRLSAGTYTLVICQNNTFVNTKLVIIR